MDRGQLANLARMPGLCSYSFERHLGFFVTTESQDPGLTSHPMDGKQKTNTE